MLPVFSPLGMKWLEYANHAAILSCLCSLPDNYMIQSCYDVKTHKAASDSRWKTHRARSWHAIPVPWQYQNVWATRNCVTESCTLQQPLRSFYTLHLTSFNMPTSNRTKLPHPLTNVTESRIWLLTACNVSSQRSKSSMVTSARNILSIRAQVAGVCQSTTPNLNISITPTTRLEDGSFLEQTAFEIF